MGIYVMNEILDMRRQLRFSGAITQDQAEQIQHKVEQASAALTEHLDLFRPVEPILSAWRETNPNARSPRWYAALEKFTGENKERAYVCIALFVQQAEGITRTDALLRIANTAARMAACNHPRGAWSGSVHTVAGEYDDDLLFSCPDCGYKGS